MLLYDLFVRIESLPDGRFSCTNFSILDDDGSEHIPDAYYSVEDMPMWMQERLSVLRMCTYEPPTKDIENVGRRINKDVFWLHNRKGA